jgi:hypothetical protein
LVISEVLYNPSSGSDSGLEWVEIYNNTGSEVVMDGYNLYADGYGYYTFPSFRLPSGNLVVVHINTAGTDSATDLYTGSGGSNMSDTAGSIAIFNSSTHNSSTIIDYLEYGSGGQTWQPAAVAAGIWTAGDYIKNVTTVGNSIALKNKAIDNNKSTDWQEQSPNPGV